MKATVNLDLPTGITLGSNVFTNAMIGQRREASVVARLKNVSAGSTSVRVELELEIELETLLTTSGVGVQFAKETPA